MEMIIYENDDIFNITNIKWCVFRLENSKIFLRTVFFLNSLTVLVEEKYVSDIIRY